ncbi:MAG: CheB methylesterase domain-containing protein [Blautia sp.]|jgi:two-component system chemotaxis response regulator CheB
MEQVELKQASRKLVLIGASAGGPMVISHILRELPADLPGIVIVQHMSNGFSQKLAEYLDSKCALKVKESSNYEVICNGNVYIAPNGCHLIIRRGKDGYYQMLEAGPKEHGVCPSVDHLFRSAVCAGENALGILLTGMGKDGAEGLLQLRKSGAATVCQEEAECPFASMPREAKKAGGVQEELPLPLIIKKIIKFSEGKDKLCGKEF